MTLSWFAIFRLGLVQLSLGAIIVLCTSTLNRLMVVEYALPAVLPGLLVALHYGIQITRPNWGFMSDQGGRRTPWITGGMAALAFGALAAAGGVILFEMSYLAGLVVSLVAYALIGLGAGASGTSLLAFLATATAEHRRPAAAAMTWLMMIAGIALTAANAGAFLDPYSPGRLLAVVAVVTGGAVVLTILAVWGLENRYVAPLSSRATNDDEPSFWQGLNEIWRERTTRHFAIFVFLSMTAYFMQELILEPYAGLVFAFSLGESTSLSGAQHGGVFLGMLTVGILASGLRIGSLRFWVVTGCLGSAVSLALVALTGQKLIPLGLTPAVVLLGFTNGAFAVAAIGSMMQLASEGRQTREGTRMGLWGAAQAIAAGFGGLFGAAAVDIARAGMPNAADAFGTVFAFEAILFLVAAYLAFRVMTGGEPVRRVSLTPGE